MWAAAPSCTPSSRPCPRWPMPATTPAWSPRRPGRRRVIDLGIRLAHSDADPAVLAHLAGELADTTTAARGGRGWEPPSPVRGRRRGARLPGRGPARLAGRVRGRGRHRHPNPTGPGRHARPGRAGHRGRRRRRGRAPARLARAAVPVRGRGHGRRVPQERRVHRHDPPGGRLRTPPGGRRPPGITETAVLRRIADQAAATAEAAAGKAPADQQEEGPGRGHRPGRRGRQPGRAAGAAVAGR